MQMSVSHLIFKTRGFWSKSFKILKYCPISPTLRLLHIYWSVVTSIHPKSLLFLFVLDVWSHPNSILLLFLLLLVTIKVTGYHTNQENQPQNEEAGDWNPIRSQMISDWTTIPVQCGYLIKDNDHNTIYMYPRAETINYKMHPVDNSE